MQYRKPHCVQCLVEWGGRFENGGTTHRESWATKRRRRTENAKGVDHRFRTAASQRCASPSWGWASTHRTVCCGRGNVCAGVGGRLPIRLPTRGVCVQTKPISRSQAGKTQWQFWQRGKKELGKEPPGDCMPGQERPPSDLKLCPSDLLECNKIGCTAHCSRKSPPLEAIGTTARKAQTKAAEHRTPLRQGAGHHPGRRGPGVGAPLPTALVRRGQGVVAWPEGSRRRPPWPPPPGGGTGKQSPPRGAATQGGRGQQHKVLCPSFSLPRPSGCHTAPQRDDGGDEEGLGQ